jgi:hypothetical protein
MSSKSKSTTDQTTHTVVTPTNPQWIANPVQSLAGRIGDLSNLDPYSLVAGADPLQTQAAAGAAGLTGQAGSFDSAANALRATMTAGPQSIQAQSLLDNLPSYMSPYLNDVTSSALADYDFGAGQTRARNQLALANDDTFGGSGGAIQTAMSEDAIDRARGTLAAQLRDQAFQTGANLSNLDAARRQEADASNASLAEQAYARQQTAANGLTNLASAYDANQRDNIATQASVGDMLRQIEAARQVAPISLLASQTGLLNSLPLSLFHGQVEDGTTHGTTTTTTSDPIGAVTSLATGLGSLMAIPYGGASNFTLGGLLGRRLGTQ